MRSFPLASLPRCSTVLLGLLCGATGCSTRADRFNERAAELVCSYNAQDPERPFLQDQQRFPVPLGEPVPELDPYGSSNCEDQVLDDLATCPDECDFNGSAARRCIRRLRRAERTGTYEEGMLEPCLAVYDCPDSVTDRCGLTTGCSMSDRPRRGGWAWLLLAVAGLRPWRRWRTA